MCVEFVCFYCFYCEVGGFCGVIGGFEVFVLVVDEVWYYFWIE